MYWLLANRKENQSKVFVIQQDANANGSNLDIQVPILSLSAANAVMKLQLDETDESNHRAGLCPMTLVDPGVISSKAKAAILAIQKDN